MGKSNQRSHLVAHHHKKHKPEEPVEHIESS
jgi:hypothetical protein